MTEVRAFVSTRSRALTWVPVTGDDGRVRMEMRWRVGGPASRARAAA